MGNGISNNLQYGISLESGVSGYLLYNNWLDSNGINARDDGLGNSWDNSAGVGNYWSDYSGLGDYTVAGTGGSADHYPNGTTLTSPSGLYQLSLTLWLLLSVAVLGIPVFFIIRTKRIQL